VTAEEKIHKIRGFKDKREIDQLSIGPIPGARVETDGCHNEGSLNITVAVIGIRRE
jgi:hypothetical protein